jgi:hypothetical protein
MAEVWVYLDESQSPNAAGTQKGQPFWVAALATEQPLQQALIDKALNDLRVDSDAVGNKSDQATLTRGYFHASLDSKNAHSWLCRSIVESGLNASFSASLWFFDRQDGREREGADLHRLSTLLSALSVLQDDYDRVHLEAARREGTFDDADIEAFPEYYRRHALGSLVSMPSIPARFPKIETRPVGGENPGIQVCDLVLWAVQRARLDGLEPQGKVDWVKYLKMKLWATGGVKDAAHQSLEGELGMGCSRPYLPPVTMPTPRDLASLTNPELWGLAQEIARDLHQCAQAGSAHARIGHMADVIRRAAEGCEAAANAAPVDLRAILSDMMEAFLLVNDTLPVYDASNDVAWSRATEKRRLAAAILAGDRPLWFPNGFSLGSVEVDVG